MIEYLFCQENANIGTGKYNWNMMVMGNISDDHDVWNDIACYLMMHDFIRMKHTCHFLNNDFLAIKNLTNFGKLQVNDYATVLQIKIKQMIGIHFIIKFIILYIVEIIIMQ